MKASSFVLLSCVWYFASPWSSWYVVDTSLTVKTSSGEPSTRPKPLPLRGEAFIYEILASVLHRGSLLFLSQMSCASTTPDSNTIAIWDNTKPRREGVGGTNRVEQDKKATVPDDDYKQYQESPGNISPHLGRHHRTNRRQRSRSPGRFLEYQALPLR